MEVEDYNLTEMPFIDVSVIDVSDNDKRKNGRLYAKKATHGKLEELLRRIRQKRTVTYVSSGAEELGSGKSALMAAAYWDLEDGKDVGTPIWTKTTGGISAGPTVGRVIDAIISAGYTESLRQKVGDFTLPTVKQLLSKTYRTPSTQISAKLAEIMELPDEDKVQKFTNVRRSLLTYSAVDFFGYFLSLFSAAGLPRFVIFVDQFEEYVQAHRGAGSLQRLSDDFRDLIEGAAMKTSLVLSLHSQAEEILRGLGYTERVAQVNQNTRITLEPLGEEDGVEIAKTYLKEFRPTKYSGAELFPFEAGVVEYLTKSVAGNAGKLIMALSNSITIGMEKGANSITMGFVTDPSNSVSILGAIPLAPQ